MLGDIFRAHGFRTAALETAPTATSLANAGVYIIVDPDTEKETARPNFMDGKSGNAIADWVKAGGVLVLMANDAGNAELKNFNTLALRFGIRFNDDNYNLVQGNQFEQGAVLVPGGNAVFAEGRKLYIKELATLQLGGPAKAILTKEGKNVIAVANYGKGKVFAIGDPWLYNEYVDGRKLPGDFHNYEAAQDLVRWLAKNAKR
jgi:unsaturated rhamnogalacturonyl hydrolase